MRLRIFVLVLAATAGLGSCEEDDDKKPYKFGFKIDKFQHRLEEKDTKGLIKGEFGFVTGDGVYHETSYATDENGDFKILGMRNYFVGLPGQDLPDITRGAKPATTTTTTTTTTPAPRPVAEVILRGIMGCSGCTIPVKEPTVQGDAALKDAAPGQPSLSVFPPLASSPPANPVPAFNSAAGPAAPAESLLAPAAPPAPAAPSAPAVAPAADLVGSRLSVPSSGVAPALENTNKVPQVRGFTRDEMLALLYRFNYTLGFHGHHEIGDRAGHKQGGYFFNGEDGFARRVDYTADEFGFHPKVTLQQLSADDTPRQDSAQRDALKGFEFVWFGVPSESAE